MEFEGVLNHVFKYYDERIKHLEQELEYSKIEKNKWNNILAIHSNESVKSAINGVTNYRQLFSDYQFIKSIAASDINETITFLGFPVDDIQLYIDLINSIKDGR